MPLELLGWLNAGFLITQNAAAAAAGLPSIDDGEEEEYEVEVEDEKEEEEESAPTSFASPPATLSQKGKNKFKI